MKDYIGKKFVDYSHMRALSFKIIAFDEETNLYIARNISYDFCKNYEAFSEENLKKVFFDKDLFIKDIDKEIEDKRNESAKYTFIADKLKEDKVFAHNFRGVCEGLRNIRSVQNLLDNFDYYFKYQKDNYPKYYDRQFILYSKEIEHYKKGIRRNKKVLYRILSKEEYAIVENVSSPTVVDDIFRYESALRQLEKEKELVIKEFDNLSKISCVSN